MIGEIDDWFTRIREASLAGQSGHPCSERLPISLHEALLNERGQYGTVTRGRMTN